jgi:hypothetical protein
MFMSTAVIPLRTGSFTLSRILFRTNMLRANTPEIPLGVLAELTVGRCRVLGMSVRRELTTREVGWLPETWQTDLAAPASFWDGQFDEAWAVAPPGEALSFLSERHAASMFVVPPRYITLPPKLMKVGDANLLDLTVSMLVDTVMKEQDVFLPKPTYIEVEKVAA